MDWLEALLGHRPKQLLTVVHNLLLWYWVQALKIRTLGIHQTLEIVNMLVVKHGAWGSELGLLLHKLVLRGF